MNDEQSSRNGTNRLTIGNGDYYFKIGTVYLASMETPTPEQVENLRTTFGIDVITDEEWRNLPTPPEHPEVDQDVES